ncbi:hypothetical protein V3C99_009601, partial [Haemonchus contortus]|uniref:DUF3885 domain-containing protein n=1 Tax=Haemonchus contortus TaxID=6289 RepID=A0A7I5EAF6_HAECO
ELKTDGELSFDFLKDFPKHKKLLEKAFNKTFEDDDLLLDYKLDYIKSSLVDATYVNAPGVILRKNKRPIFFMYKYEDHSAERITPGEFIDNLVTYNIFEPFPYY